MGTWATLIRKASFSLFESLDHIGIHVLPKTFYTPIADYSWLKKNMRLWARPIDLTGIRWDLDEQLSWLESICDSYYSEVQGLDNYNSIAKIKAGYGYGPIESQVLHCFIRSKKPRRIIEIGAGVSTYCSSYALELNAKESSSGKLICIEPFPKPRLKALPNITLIPQMLQEVDLRQFDQLSDGDLLFIDSTHAVKTGSDVLVLLLEVIPRLSANVFIHIHDIFLPYLYQRNALDHYYGWQETALLLALLKGNNRLKLLCCLSGLHYERRDHLMRVLPDYKPQEEDAPGLSLQTTGFFPSSTWIMTT